MVPSPDPSDQRAAREERPGEREDGAVRPEPELRWVQIREPRQAVEIGANGRVLASRYHDGYDAWEVLLETDAGDCPGEGQQNGRR